MAAATAPRRTALYGRTSDDESEGRSVDDQLAEQRKWATETGRTVIAELRDDGVSASRYARRKKDRPDWQRAMELIAGGQVDELSVWEVSRSTRDRAVWSALIAACIENHVDMAVGGKVHDPADPDDGFMLDLGAALAVREVAMLSKRVRRAVNSRAAAGRPAGSVPYGYKRVIDPDTGKTVGRTLHPEQAPIVREIADRLLKREPAYAVAADLNGRGVPTGTGARWIGHQVRPYVRDHPGEPLAVELDERLARGETPSKIAADLTAREVANPAPARWSGGNLSKVAVRPTYAGLRVHHGKVLPGVTATWPPIITEAEHYRLTAMYEDPARDKFRNPTHAKHLGTGIFRCGRDGCTGRVKLVVGYGTKPASYTCRTCFRVSRRQTAVDDLVNEVMCRWLSSPAALAALSESDDSNVSAAAEEVARLKIKLREARQAWDDDRMSLESYTDMEARTLPKIRAAEERARPKSTPPALYDVAAAGERVRDRWFGLPIGERRACVAWAWDVVILPVGSPSVGFDAAGVRITPRGRR